MTVTECFRRDSHPSIVEKIQAFQSVIVKNSLSYRMLTDKIGGHLLGVIYVIVTNPGPVTMTE